MHDILTIGAGPAGLNASLYAARYRLKPIIFGELLGGQMSISVDVQNYLGFSSIAGPELVNKCVDHVKDYDVEIKMTRVEKIEKNSKYFKAITAEGEEYMGRTMLLCTGANHRHLNIPGEKEFSGKGVHYCVTCDGFFYKHKTAAVAGGGDSAVTAALYLADICEKVYLIHRRTEFRAETIWVEKAKAKKNIEFILENNVIEFTGDKKLEKIKFEKEYNGNIEMNIDGFFIEIGQVPDPTLPNQLGVELDERGYIKINFDGSTNIEGLFAAGENTNGHNHFNQIITTAAEGAIAANSIFNFLNKQ